MRNLLTKLRYVPKHFAVVAALVLATVGTAAAFAWGPSRTTYTMENPADHPVFNSITNNPNYGDEREFVIVRDLTTGSSYGDSTNLVPGHEYQVQVYVHNNAHPDYNASGKGVAKDTTVRAVVPASVTGSDTVDGFVKASNATPTEVWDTAELKSTNKVDLEYVSGSAHLSTHAQQVDLPDTILTTGVKVGDKDLSGDWRGCLEYAGIVTFKFRVKDTTSSFTMSKQVRAHSTTSGGWVETYAAKPGETVDFLIRYQNTGNLVQENVTIKDTLPAGLSYVAGSTVLANGENHNGKSVADGVTAGGINIGNYTPQASAWVRFSAKVADKDKLSCGTNTLKNVASVITGAGTKTDDAIVTVDKTCEAPGKITVCDLKTWEVKEIAEKDFDSAKHSKNLADCKEQVCDLTTKQIITINKKDYDTAKYTRDMSRCAAAPTPDTLPSTGPGAVIGGLFGSSALGLGISSYVRSRAALRDALNR